MLSSTAKLFCDGRNALSRFRFNPIPAATQNGRAEEDRKLLAKWRNASLTCIPHIYETYEDAVAFSPRRSDWKVVSYQSTIDTSSVIQNKAFSQKLPTSEELLSNTRRIMLRFDNGVCPKSVAAVSADWQTRARYLDTAESNNNAKNDETALMQVGDRFIQRIDLLPYISFFGQDQVFNQLVMDEVTHIYDTPEKCGFTVVTTDQHDEIGEHTLWLRIGGNNTDNRDDEIKQNRNGSGKSYLVLESVSASTFKSHVFGPGRWYARLLQKRAHELSQEHLLTNLKKVILSQSTNNAF